MNFADRMPPSLNLQGIGGPLNGQSKNVHKNDFGVAGGFVYFWNKRDDGTMKKEGHRIKEVRFYTNRRIDKQFWVLLHESVSEEEFHERIKELK